MPNFSNYAEQLAAHTKIFHGKDTNKPSAKANFICILPRRSIQNEVKDTKNSQKNGKIWINKVSVWY